MEPTIHTVKISPPNRLRHLTGIRALLHEKYGGACAFCGTSDVPLEAAHIIPRAAGGTDELDNFILLCPNCHRRMNAYGPQEIEFVNYLAGLLKLSPRFRDVNSELPLGVKEGSRADISAEQELDQGWTAIILECKSYPAFSSQRLAAVLNQITFYREQMPDATYALAFPGRLSEKHRELVSAHDIELWDIDYLATTFADEVQSLEHPYFQPLLQAVLRETQGATDERLLAELKACPAGKKQWAKYQKLVSDILESLFCPPLNSPISELSDMAGVNRRDIILPNYALEGFWRFLRDSYGADYLVADAKNYVGPVKKSAALQVANYLKSYGAGLFGLIVCRTSGDRGCMHVLREQWMAHGKMILMFNDEDLEAMLLAKSSGGQPEEVIRQKIEEFRLSL